MIRATAGNLLILGIDAENVRRLKDGKPILVKGEELGVSHDVLIAYGETLEDVAKELNLPRVQ